MPINKPINSLIYVHGKGKYQNQRYLSIVHKCTTAYTCTCYANDNSIERKVSFAPNCVLLCTQLVKCKIQNTQNIFEEKKHQKCQFLRGYTKKCLVAFLIRIY